MKFFKYLVDHIAIVVLGSSPLNFSQIPDKQEVDSITPHPPPPKKNVDSG